MLVISQETSPVLHLHGIIGQKKEKEENENDIAIKQLLRTRIQEIYPGAKGNKHLYTSKVTKKQSIFKYTLKEGNYKFQGLSKSFIKEQEKLSSTKEHLNEKVIQNEENLILGKISFLQFKIQYINIKVDHNQNLYRNHIKSYFLRFQFKSDRMSIEDWIMAEEL